MTDFEGDCSGCVLRRRMARGNSNGARYRRHETFPERRSHRRRLGNGAGIQAEVLQSSR
jgi:hypothetical protein